MPDRFIRLIVTDDVIPAIKELGSTCGVELSEPQPTDSTAEPLNAPLAGADPITALAFITAVLTASTSLIEFLQALIVWLEKEGKEIEVSDVSGKRRVPVTGESNPHSIAKELGDV